MSPPNNKPPEKLPLDKVFAPGGWLAKHHPKYEFRPGQLEMAESVEFALESRQHLIVEAGTGTGKTLAYLVPLLRSGLRTVISTGTKNLQEQLFYKDVPFLKKLFPQMKVTLMKGRANYLCRQKLYDMEKQPVLDGMDEVEQYPKLRQWEETTETGDRAELRWMPDQSELWKKVDARREACTGQKCALFDRCFITQMHQRAAESDLLIVNHHLFFADLALRQNDYSALLPEYAALVFDEAHDMEDVATQYFGVEVSSYRMEELARDTEATLRLKGVKSNEVLAAVGELRRRADLFFELFPGSEGRSNFDNRDTFLTVNRGAYSSLSNALMLLQTELSRVPERPEEINNMMKRAKDLRATLEIVMESHERNMVYWWERRGRGVFVQATPIDVSALLREKLFEQVESVILTSATLAVGGSFDFLKRRLGVQNAKERVFSSHFDYANQSLLYTPIHLPDPRQPDFGRLASEEVAQLLKATRGRAFVLFTSYSQMRDVYERVRQKVRYPLLIQGSMPRTQLLDSFRATPHAVLFGTSSFWQGVDVQGEQLSAVMIDRLPFAVPSDPVTAARIRQINDEGGNAFTDYQVPQAVITLKQGFGRLIRSETDRGILVMLDQRLMRMPYGKTFLESLPPYHQTNRLEDVKAFMRE